MGIVVDCFAGGGGASLGIHMALGRGPDIAINHDREAVAMHAVNHPETRHYCEDVWDVDPVKACAGRTVDLAWFSPDCTFHSKARGGKPHRDRNRARRRRGLAWLVVRWAKAVRPSVIALENVEEFQDWGPLLDDGSPCPIRKGFTFRRWVAMLEGCGYRVEARELRACDYGAPTIRKRLFVIARCDGLPIVWPTPTHGKGLTPFHTAAECIDWSIPCPSIFLTKDEARAVGVKRPLADKTLARIARGIWKYVINAAEPFIIPVTHHGDFRSHPVSEPFRTVTAAHRGEHALVTPFLAGVGGRMGQSDARTTNAPYHTTTAKADTVLVTPFLTEHANASKQRVFDANEPLRTATAQNNHHSVVTAQLDLPFNKHTDRREQVRAFLIAYYGNGEGHSVAGPSPTIVTKDRFGLVTVNGQEYTITDIGLRMLRPRELFRAQGFPDEYIIDRGPDGKALTTTAQVRMCGNSVCPDVAAAIVRANVNVDRAATVAS